MSSPSEVVTGALLKGWGLPDPGDSKKSRGQVIVVGGSRRSPGAVLLAGESALRVGAGRLGLVVPGSIDAHLGVMIPEAAVFALPEAVGEELDPAVREELATADAVLFGPGFDDAEQTHASLRQITAGDIGCLVLDAFALGILPDFPRSRLPRVLILNPNEEEAAILLGRDLGGDRVAEVSEIARRFDAVVNCYGTIATPAGRAWVVRAGGPGLGTSGSGDVLAGAITGFAARGVDPVRAAVWGSWTHAQAGDRLTKREGIGFLARDLATELTSTLADAIR
ncbi:yjeF C-terminal region, hydroxyethylthiazole kinase-related [Microbacterium sp. cf046]|uniref:NAD(P)H-hydrate dehydratase n=1 Tax=Microbacterium sp. cf046 TaxID=1761803 RepID=UPI0008E64548|nr:NAD(P)H-hydrate dehydratase [Microbacterium sp. cf046]SFR92409.1 yjeF C-terminal region, hydroxyethylthiazole kinase-related [Microbacterium sp. cf046]